ncbi:serine/threonine-protein kinase [Larkinella sp.]|uniref:serine/threonine-protein kinase n=1 Tax=Larkinella sp. TaxID=2034517 RepID=UPI003BACD4E7
MNTEFSLCYNIQDLAVGGQKKVWKGDHPVFGSVALKEGTVDSLNSLERIKREIETLGSISSEYYPKQFYYSDNPANNIFYIIEEYIQGETLRTSSNLFDSEEKIIDLFEKLLDALEIIWQRRIVHRDLKPENIIITPTLSPCILDLGIAKYLDRSSLTNTFQAVGPCTPFYGAPEQLLNKKNEIDIRADFFALGIILLELHLGFHPFDPIVLRSKYPIPYNIINGDYVRASAKPGTSIFFTKLTDTLLRVQPYQRFRNLSVLKKFVSENT